MLAGKCKNIYLTLPWCMMLYRLVCVGPGRTLWVGKWQLISAFVFTIRIVQFLYYLNPKFQPSSRLLWLYSPVCVGPGQKTGFLTTRLNSYPPRHNILFSCQRNHMLLLDRFGQGLGNICSLLTEPRCEKTGLRSFRPGPTQTGMYNHRRWLEA